MIKDFYYKLKHQIEQFYYNKKYGSYNIPIKNKDSWYYKQSITHKNKEKIEINKTKTSTMYHFENYTNSGLVFRYTSGNYENVSPYNKHQHHHDFYMVLEEVYYFPESFYISNEFKDCYTERMLQWIEKLRKQCLKDDLKDIGYYEKSDKKNYDTDLVYNIQELKKRNINKLYGINIKKYIKKYDDDYIYLKFKENWKIDCFKKI